MNGLWPSNGEKGGQLRLNRLLCCALAPAMLASSARAAESAGTVVTNTANIRFDQDGETRAITSNTVTLTLNELLDVSIAPVNAVIAAGPSGTDAVPFVVTNGGNGNQNFVLSGETDGNGRILGVAADADGNGTYDSDTDPILTGGVIAIAAGEAAPVFILVNQPLDSGTDATITAKVRAAPGTGPAGTVLTGAGKGGIDAIIGASGAQATASAKLVSSVAPTLTKSQAVIWSNDGSSRALRDSIILYTLEARFPAATRAVEVEDPVPTGTAYVPGSLTLDGAAMSDAADADQGAFDNQSIRVALGNVPAGRTNVIQFKVRIQ